MEHNTPTNETITQLMINTEPAVLTYLTPGQLSDILIYFRNYHFSPVKDKSELARELRNIVELEIGDHSAEPDAIDYEKLQLLCEKIVELL